MEGYDAISMRGHMTCLYGVIVQESKRYSARDLHRSCGRTDGRTDRRTDGWRFVRLSQRHWVAAVSNLNHVCLQPLSPLILLNLTFMSGQSVWFLTPHLLFSEEEKLVYCWEFCQQSDRQDKEVWRFERNQFGSGHFYQKSGSSQICCMSIILKTLLPRWYTRVHCFQMEPFTVFVT